MPENRAYQFLYDEAGIAADMKICMNQDRHAFSHIIVILSELRGNPSLSENFVLVGWQDATIEDVAWIESLQAEGINANRVKLWEARGWRLIFFADHPKRKAALVAIMKREQNYEEDTVLWARLRESYERLGFA